MEVSEERLRGIDEELSQLGKSEEEVGAILVRFAEAERPGLAVVDEELEALAAGSEGVDALLAAAHARVPQEPAEPDIVVDVDVEAAGVATDVEPVMPEEDDEDASLFEGAVTQIHAPLTAETAAIRPVLDEANLFGDADDESVPPPATNLADMFGDEPLAAGADPLDALDDPRPDLEHALYDDEEPDHTSVFTVDEIAAIQRDSIAPAAPDTGEDDLIVSSPIDPRIAEVADSELPPPADQLDEDLDAMLGASIRAGIVDDADVPVEVEVASAAEVATDDFELLVDDDILVVDEEALAPPPRPVSAVPPPPPASVMPPGAPSSGAPAESISAAPPSASAPPAGEGAEDDADAPKKGFFKKLFGGDKT